MSSTTTILETIQDIIGTDAGDRGMKPLIVPGDLQRAAETLVEACASTTSTTTTGKENKNIVILSGFPCCVTQTPPTETDGPPGACAIARAAVALLQDEQQNEQNDNRNRVIMVTDDCNYDVFAAACEGINGVELQSFSSNLTDEEEARFKELIQTCTCLIACERAGPAKDGICYTMRGIDMNEKGLIAPLHRFASERNNNTSSSSSSSVKFIAIGDGGNELGMGKVYDKIIDNPKIPAGPKIACAVAADYVIAASVSNWGGYALAAAAAVVKATAAAKTTTTTTQEKQQDNHNTIIQDWVDKCLPSEQDEIDLLNRCVAKGCRDGVSGQVEATVDGMPLETSLQCLRDIRTAALTLE